MSDEKNLHKGQRLVFGASMPRQVVFEIDKIRGDTPRSLWLQRLVIKELERQRKLKGEEGRTFKEKDFKNEVE